MCFTQDCQMTDFCLHGTYITEIITLINIHETKTMET